MKSKPKDFKTIDDAFKKISKPELNLEQLLYFEQLMMQRNAKQCVDLMKKLDNYNNIVNNDVNM